jgi:hypothetical protein
MRTLPLLAALFLAVPGFAAQVGELRAVPQAQLGALPADLKPLALRLRASIPTVLALDLSVPPANAGAPAGPAVAALPADARVTPAIYAADKAQALLGRLTAAEPEDAKKTVAAVNAVLKDFTPERIAKMPAEEIAALSGLLFDHMGAPRADQRPGAEAAAVLARASAERMLSQRGKPMTEVLLNPGHNESHPDDIEVHGVVEDIKPVESGGVWRHYTTKDGYDAIVRSGVLQNGFVPYVRLSRGTFRKVFKDMNGLFLTKPDVDGGDVGVPKSEYPHYVDIVLPAAMTVLEIEAGKIWLVPLPGRARGWVAALYRKWADTGHGDSVYRKAVVDMDASGGPGPDISVPVTIVKKGKTG